MLEPKDFEEDKKMIDSNFVSFKLNVDQEETPSNWAHTCHAQISQTGNFVAGLQDI